MAIDWSFVFSALVAVSTIVVAASTVFYAVLTGKLVGETRRMREVQTEPKVSLFIRMNEYTRTGLDMVIRNVGQGPAYNVKFNFTGNPSFLRDDHPIDELPIIRDGLAYLPPNETFWFLLGYLTPERHERAAQNPWSFEVHYENQGGKRSIETFHFNFSQFTDFYTAGRSPLPKLEEHLSKIQRDVNYLLTGSNKINVITQTQEEARKEMEEFIEKQRRNAATEDGSQSE